MVRPSWINVFDWSWKRIAVTLFVFASLQLAYIIRLELGSRNMKAPLSYTQDAIASVATRQSIALPSDQQCRSEYSRLFADIDRATAYWTRSNHMIVPGIDTDISWRSTGAFRILIHNNELRILETRNTFTDAGYRPRTLATLSQIQEALWAASALGERIPTLEAAIVVDDVSKIPTGTTHTLWTLTSQTNDSAHDRHWLIPDFNFHSSTSPSGTWRDTQRRAAQQDAPVSTKIQRAVWRGVSWSNEVLRLALLKVTESKSWSDVAIADWSTPEMLMTIDQLCQYAMNIHTEGRSYSSRLAFLLNCGSVTLVHELQWKTHFTHLLQTSGPEQNVVSVQRDFSDLEDRVRWYLAHPHEAQGIADMAVRTFRNHYLSPPATTCYWRQLMTAYGKSSLIPEIYEPNDKSGDAPRMRGIPFEEFIHLRKDYTL